MLRTWFQGCVYGRFLEHAFEAGLSNAGKGYLFCMVVFPALSDENCTANVDHGTHLEDMRRVRRLAARSKFDRLLHSFRLDV
jgi:hypothetical protein